MWTPTSHIGLSPYLLGRVTRSQRLLDLILKAELNNANPEDLTATDSTTFAPAPPPPTLANDSAYMKDSLTHPTWTLASRSPHVGLQLAFATTSYTHQIQCVDICQLRFIAAVAMAPGIRFHLLVCLWRLHGQLQTKHSPILDPTGMYRIRLPPRQASTRGSPLTRHRKLAQIELVCCGEPWKANAEKGNYGASPKGESRAQAGGGRPSRKRTRCGGTRRGEVAPTAGREFIIDPFWGPVSRRRQRRFMSRFESRRASLSKRKGVVCYEDSENGMTTKANGT
ncbi:hypothetical protein BJY52DRAFT_1228214 [Lactarius psammicola]|nr:hypothetical protein BJY52DRAFT_1228214 [Lactarius psammicola]